MDQRETHKLVPVLLPGDKHVFAQAKIIQTPDETTITLVVNGKFAREVGELISAPEVVALSFAGLPVQPRKNHKKEN